MRIGIDASRAFVPDPTGTERYACEVITRMLKLPEAREHEWILYTRKLPPSFVPPPSLGGGKGVVVKEISLPYLWTQVGLAWRTWIDRLDILWVPAHTLPVLRRPGLKTLVTIHGLEYEWLPAYENKLQRWYLPWSTMYAVKYATKLIAVSEFTKGQLIERLNADGRKIKVILEGYDPQTLNSKSEIPNKLQILNKYKLKPKKYLLFVGTVQPRKNLERLIEAFAKMTINSPLTPLLNQERGTKGVSFNLKLVIAGKLGWLYGSILAAPDKFGVKDRVIFTGYIDDEAREQLLHNCLGYVQPSITEGFGLPVLEAMAAGVPVVSSHGGALKEVVGGAGILFDPLDVLQIRNSMELVTGSNLVRRQLIKKGKERVKQFSWEKTAKETLSLISRKL